MRKRFVTTLIIGIISVVCVLGIAACNEVKTPVSVTGITLNKQELSLNFGEKETLVATVQPADATDKSVIWSSSDESVATVNNGEVNALKAGTATITATANGFSATCALTVKARKFTEEEWKAAFDATLKARDFTLKAGDGELSMEYKFDWDNKIISEGGLNFVVAESGKYYSYYEDNDGWRKESLSYESDEEMFLFLINRSFANICNAAKNVYSEVEYDVEKDEYSVNLVTHEGESGDDYVFTFADGKLSKYVDESGFIVEFYDYGTTTVTLPEEAKNA